MIGHLPLRRKKFMPLSARSFAQLAALCAVATSPSVSSAFGDEGHEVVALVARSNLTPSATAAVDRLLATDKNPFKMRDGGMTSDSFERQATWADYYRDSQRASGVSPEPIHSYSWHFVDIELQGGSLETACFGFPVVAPGTTASQGPDPDCIVNKIEEFTAELSSPSIPDDEKLRALKFLMHFVGDIHQPLHASDNLDHGGNKERAVALGKTAALHGHWDTTFVTAIGAAPGTQNTDAHAVAAALRTPSATERGNWLGTPKPRTWALESFTLAQSYAYGALPPLSKVNTKQVYQLDATYSANATKVTADQLNKAGYRLAAILNAAFDH
jgi:hypothetical protein